MSQHEPQRPYARLAWVLGGGYLYLPFNPLFIEQFKAQIPPWAREWQADESRWYVNAQSWQQAFSLAQHFWPRISIFRDGAGEPFAGRRTRPGESEWARQNGQRSSWSAGPPPPLHYQHLYITVDAPPEVIHAAYKALSRKHHPDNGGTTEDMQRINAAYAAIKKERRL